MERTERFYKIDRLLRDNRSVSLERFLEVLSISKATFKRDIEYMRDRLSAPIIWDRELRGYIFDETIEDAQSYELPGIWFKPLKSCFSVSSFGIAKNNKIVISPLGAKKICGKIFLPLKTNKQIALIT